MQHSSQITALLALALALAPPMANAYNCLAAHGALDPAASAAAERDPQAEISRLDRELTGASPAGHNQRARLYAELANAAIINDQPGRTRDASRAGLAAIDDPSERALIDALSMLEAFALSELGERPLALERYKLIAARVPDSAAYYVCVLDDLSYVYYRNDDVGAAVTHLIHAYTLAAAPGYEADRAATADELAAMFERLDFLDEALPLAEEALDLYRQLGDERGLSDAHRRLGETLGVRGDFDAAERNLTEALRLARRVPDRFRELFTSLSICNTERRAGDFPAAERACQEARQIATGFESPTAGLDVDIASGELELARGHPRLALQALDAALAVPSGAGSRALRKRIQLARGQALQAIGDYRGAFAAADSYIAESRLDTDEQTAARVAMLRVQFETERKDRELRLAMAQKSLLEQQRTADRRTRDLVILGAVLSLAIMALYLAARRARLNANQARHDAEQRLDAVGRLTGGVAHDFNNLMTVILQAVGLLSPRPALRQDPVAQSLLADAYQAAATGGAITRQLLAFSRQLDLRPQRLQLGDYLEQLRPILERAAGGRARLAIGVQPLLPAVHVDPAQFTTALINLVVNAADAMAASGTIQIDLRAVPAAAAQLAGGAAAVRIDVSDDGCGMPAEVLSRAVEPFFSTKGPGHGSGLGLSVVDGFVRQSGGRLAIDSAPGRGTNVSVWLPCEGGAT